MGVTILNIDFTEPFMPTEKGRIRTLGLPRKRPGVYLIKENEVIVYVGMSASCVVTAMYRHFYRWSDSKTGRAVYRVTYNRRLSENKYTCIIIHTETHQAAQMEKAFIRSIKPRDNRNYYEEQEDIVIEQAKIIDFDFDKIDLTAEEAPF